MASASSPAIGILLPTRGILLQGDAPPNAGLVLELAQRAEAAGCASVWVGDSLTAKPRLDPLAALAAVAARTSRVRLGTAVLLGALYHPVLLARTAASVDILSGGRLTLAMGVGGAFTDDLRREWTAAGVDSRRRAGRLAETATLLPRLWREPAVTFQGRHFQFEGLTLEPRPLQEGGVPLWLACHAHTGSEAQYRRAARLAGGIIGITDTPEQFADVLSRFRALAAEAGRDAEALDAAIYLTTNLNPDAERARAEADTFIRAYYGHNFWGDRWGPWGPPELLLDRIRQYAAAGARHVILRFASFDPLAQLELLAREVLPALPVGESL